MATFVSRLVYILCDRSVFTYFWSIVTRTITYNTLARLTHVNGLLKEGCLCSSTAIIAVCHFSLRGTVVAHHVFMGFFTMLVVFTAVKIS